MNPVIQVQQHNYANRHEGASKSSPSLVFKHDFMVSSCDPVTLVMLSSMTLIGTADWTTVLMAPALVDLAAIDFRGRQCLFLKICFIGDYCGSYCDGSKDTDLM